MQSPELLEQTASERLTLEQEYDMQNSWFQDENSKPHCCELNPYIVLSVNVSSPGKFLKH